MPRNVVEIDEDLFIDLIYERIDEVKHNWGDYGTQFNYIHIKDSWKKNW